MTYISQEYNLIINLSNAAHEHKKNCNENCNVSLTQLKMAAEYIFDKAILSSDEPYQIKKLLNEWPH